MAQPPRNYANLGYKVTTRSISWEQQCREIEGASWDDPYAIYFFGDGQHIVFVQYDLAVNFVP